MEAVVTSLAPPTPVPEEPIQTVPKPTLIFLNVAPRLPQLPDTPVGSYHSKASFLRGDNAIFPFDGTKGTVVVFLIRQRTLKLVGFSSTLPI